MAVACYCTSDKYRNATCFCQCVGNIELTEIKEGDEESFVDCLTQEPPVQNYTMRIPYPFSMDDAIWWVQYNTADILDRGGLIYNFAIRGSSGKVMGVIGINEINDGTAEIGYWLAPRFWGLQIMPRCIETFISIITSKKCEYGIRTLQACICDGNERSVRVVERCGFRFIEHLPDYYEKNGKLISAVRYQLDLSSS